LAKSKGPKKVTVDEGAEREREPGGEKKQTENVKYNPQVCAQRTELELSKGGLHDLGVDGKDTIRGKQQGVRA